MVDRFERFSYAVSGISKYWHKIAADEMAKYGLKGPHAVYLVAMHQSEEGMTAAKLAELCGKDKADVSRMIAIMEKKGLVRREEVNKNSYRALLKLTEVGHEAAKHVCSRTEVAVELGGRGVSDEHRRMLYESLELIAANLREISLNGLPNDEA